MTPWVDVVVYAMLNLAIWEGLAACSRFAIPVVADRNPEWLAVHPDVRTRLTEAVWFTRSCRLWGGLSVAAIVAARLGAWPASWQGAGPRWEMLKDLNSALVVAGLIYVLAWVLLFERWLRTTVALAQRRQATLVPRAAVHQRKQLGGKRDTYFHAAACRSENAVQCARTPGDGECCEEQQHARDCKLRNCHCPGHADGKPSSQVTRHEREQIGYAPPELVNRVLHLVPLEALALVPEAGIGSLAEAQRRGNDLNIRIRDLERYGRALLLDGTTANGKRVMMWAE